MEKYQQIADDLRTRIAGGAYPNGELPPANALADEFDAGIRTVQRALVTLDRAGITAGRQGRPRVILVPGDSAATRYEQIAAAVTSDIRSGSLAAGARVPSEVELMERHGVSRATVRDALGLLERSAAVVKRAGRRYVAGDESSPDLAYGRVAATLRSRIAAGTYRSEQRLPGENALAAELNVSRPTVRQALTKLERDGLVRPEPKRGWFVNAARGEGDRDV